MNKEVQKISEFEYNYYAASGEYATNLETVIESHKHLANKTIAGEDCGLEFIKELLLQDWGRNFVHIYPKGVQEFFKSTYLSDFFKENIQKLLKISTNNKIFIQNKFEKVLGQQTRVDENDLISILTYISNYSDEYKNKHYSTYYYITAIIKRKTSIRLLKRKTYIELLKFIQLFYDNHKQDFTIDQQDKKIFEIINQEQDFNDMSENDINTINLFIKKYNHNNINGKFQNITNYFETYLYKLDGEGVIGFLKNHTAKANLINQLLLTSGLSDRADFYIKNEVNNADLNEKNLLCIFKKLYILDPEYANNYLVMVKNIDILSPNNFINEFKRFGKNNFCYLHNESNNVLKNFNNDYDNYIILNSQKKYNSLQSEKMKNSFFNTIKKIANEENTKYEKVKLLTKEDI